MPAALTWAKIKEIEGLRASVNVMGKRRISYLSGIEL
jgi:hypothetical protein